MKTAAFGVPKKSLFGSKAVTSFSKPETEEEPIRQPILSHMFDEWFRLQDRATNLEDELFVARREIKRLDREVEKYKEFLEALKVEPEAFEVFAKTGKLQ